MIVGVDVDGVVADLMGAYAEWLFNWHGISVRREEFTCHSVAGHDCRSPMRLSQGVIDRFARYWTDGQRGAFLDFMGLSDAYRNVRVIDGSQDAIERIRSSGIDVVFVTALMSTSDPKCIEELERNHYASKMRWLRTNFPGVPVITCPSRLKQHVAVDVLVDDRYDTVERVRAVGGEACLFGQPWNEAPETEPRFDWPELGVHIPWLKETSR